MMTILRKQLLPIIILLACTLCLSGHGTAQRYKLGPQAIIKRMVQSYSQCASYKDTGMVETTYHEAMSGRYEKMPFKIYFQRPNYLRVEWTDYSPYKDGRTRVVWSNGKEAFTYWEPERYEKEESVRMAFAGANGVSKGAAHTVPRLLTEEVSGFSLPELVNPSLVGEEEFEGEPCYHIKAKHPYSDSAYELWISRRDFFLRKLRIQTKYDEYYVVEDEIHRDISANQPIASTLFDFKPPIPLSTRKETELESSLGSDEDIKWSEFYSQEGRFKALMPGKPTKSSITVAAGSGQIVHNIFKAAGGGLVCVINYADLPEAVINPTDIKTLFDSSRDEMLKVFEGKLANEKSVSLQGYPGREVQINISGGEAKGRFFVVKERLYQLFIMRLKLADESSNEADRFFGSFQIVPDAKSVAVLSRLKLLTEPGQLFSEPRP